MTVQSCRMAGLSDIIVYANGATRTGIHDKLGVNIIWNEEGIGPAAAREQGAKHATGELLFFLDDDSILPNDIFSDIPDADAVFYPSRCWQDGPISYDYELLPKALDNHIDYPIRWEPRQLYPYPCISGPNGQFLVKRSVWEELDGYGGTVDGYGPEELMLGLKLKMYGFHAVCDPRYPVWHFPSREMWKNRDQAFLDRCAKVVDVLRQDKKAKYSLEEVYERFMA